MLDLLSILILALDFAGSVCLAVCVYRVLSWVLPRVDEARFESGRRPLGVAGRLVAPVLAALSFIL